MITLRRTNSGDPDFISLVHLLDADLALRDGADHAFYAQFNTIDKIKHAIIAYVDGHPVGCGAIKAFSDGVMEVKRMYVIPAHRNRGVASAILGSLEAWALELGCRSCVLETGRKQPEALELYSRKGYERIPNYAQYAGVENSLCFEKQLGITTDDC